MTLSRSLIAVIVLSTLTVPLAAQLSAELQEWGRGPAQWLMTREEERAWKKLKTDQEANDFIDLFWARRDPTPGTATNEFRQEYRNREAWADERFGEGKVRGAMTDRGRAGIVLGMPSVYDRTASEESKVKVRNNPTGTRRMGARDVWAYDREKSLEYGLPKIEIVFVQDPISGQFRRDTQRPDFMFALPNAIRKQLVNPDLVTIPDWAQRGGLKSLEQPQLVIQTAEDVIPAAPGAATPPGVGTAAVKQGAGQLTLLKDVLHSLNPRSGKDPFAGVTSLSKFGTGDELGYAFQVCNGVTGESPMIKVGVTITGTAAGEKIRMTAPVEETVPDAIRGMAGCYLVRGQLGALADLQVQPGEYQLLVNIEDPTAGQSYNLTQPFKVE